MSWKQVKVIPMVDEAIEFTHENLIEIKKTLGDKVLISPYPNEQDIIQIKTLEGNHYAHHGDYIIKGIGGELYIKKKNIFDKEYTEESHLHYCLYCHKELLGKVHGNRKYCSNKCIDKKRYSIVGSTYSPERYQAWKKNKYFDVSYRSEKRKKDNERNKELKKFIAKYKLEHGCVDCGYKVHHVALDFDHVMGKKEINICFAKSKSRAIREMAKCEVVCSNCHRIRTYNRIKERKND